MLIVTKFPATNVTASCHSCIDIRCMHLISGRFRRSFKQVLKYERNSLSLSEHESKFMNPRRISEIVTTLTLRSQMEQRKHAIVKVDICIIQITIKSMGNKLQGNLLFLSQLVTYNI